MSGIRRSIARAKKGSVSLMAALLLPALVGMAGLGVEYGRGLQTRVQNQRVADLGAFGGALAYISGASTATVTATVGRIATLNGLAAGAAVAAIVASPGHSGRQAVQVTVTTTLPMVLATFVGGASTLPVSATAYVEIVPGGTPACIIALATGGTGVTLSGGTVVSAPACAVASNSSVTVPNGTSMTTPLVGFLTNVDGVTSPVSDINIHPPAGKPLVTYSKATTADPLNGNTVVASTAAHLATVAALAGPSAPSSPISSDLAFTYFPTTISRAGCSGTLSGSVWTFTCPVGSYQFRNMTLGGGLSLNFNVGGSSSSNFGFSQVSNGGATINFGPGTYNIAGGISTGGGSTTNFAAGTFNIGPNASGSNNCPSELFSICHRGASLTFAGPSSFALSAGVYVAGGSILLMGSGTANSYQIGPGSTGDAIWLGGGGTLTFADATGGGNVFQTVGMVNVGNGGGSCLTLPAASQHDMNGSFSSAGGSVLGAGVYSVNGYFALGSGGGGDVSCGGTMVGLTGSGVTLALSGTSTPGSGSCAAQVFCVAAGFNHVTLTAPASGTTNSLVVLGPTVPSYTGGATLTEGAASTSLSGVMYFPYGPISLGGGASVGNGSGQCLELIGTQISLTGGTTAATTCSGLGGGTGGSGSLTALLVR